MKVCAIILKYEEPGWTEATLEAVRNSPGIHQVTWVDRGGTGPITMLNQGVENVQPEIELLWFLTNVAFDPLMLDYLQHAFAKWPDLAAVHPAHNSDHPHLRPDGPNYSLVPFVEWTAPLVKRSAWDTVGKLDEEMPYWGHDLDWSMRARLLGFQLAVCRSSVLEHDYLKSREKMLEVTRRREKIRAGFDRQTEKVLRKRWGADWMKRIWPSHHYNSTGRKTIYG